jgi:hypothetical protein
MAGKSRSKFVTLTRGKVRRFFYAHTRRGRDHIDRMKRRRRGECRRCGACCRLVYRCPFLRMDGDLAVCTVHQRRPQNCRIFPVDRLDLEDRDLVDPARPCGFWFVEDKGG